MNEIKEYTEKIFEDIKHIDEYSNDTGQQENYKMYQDIINGEA